MLLDLGIKLIKANNNRVSFVTSDNPVIVFNQFAKPTKELSNLGIAMSGLQIFLPISPKIVILFYDLSVYSVGKNKSWIVELTNESDIQALNRLQVYNSYENIYFNPSLNKDKILELLKVKDPTDNKNESTFREVKIDSKKMMQLLRLGHIPLSLRLKEIRIKKSALKNTPANERINSIRNPQLVYHYENYKKAVEDGKYGYVQFWDYVKDNKIKLKM